MNEILSKISSYNIFNYLFPGAVFSVFANKMSVFEPPTELVEQILWFYFIGLVISRLGSVVVEPLLKKSNVVEFEPYHDFLTAQQVDTRIEVMVEVANTYRTLMTCFLLLLGYAVLQAIFVGPVISSEGYYLLGALVLLFVASYRKQCGFVSGRVKKAVVTKNEQN